MGIWLVFLLHHLVVTARILFEKPIGFEHDGSHDRLFWKTDIDRNGFISKNEFLSASSDSSAIFEYLLARREGASPKMDPAGNTTLELTYSEFMWFYRESQLFGLEPAESSFSPHNVSSFPKWEGMQSVPISEESGEIGSREFWTQYVGPHKSVVLRNGLAGSVGLELWKDAEYLKGRFGDLEAKIEVKLESRGDRRFHKPLESGRAKISHIIDGQVDGYVVSVVPQAMAWEVNVPNAILCGKRERKEYLGVSKKFGFMTELEETSLWISRGRTRSQFHYDKENTFNCLVSGNPKQWVLLDTRKYAHLLPWVRGGGFNQKDDLLNRYTDWVGIDVDNLDLNLHSYLTQVQFEVLTQNPGDCVFLPYSMLHYALHPGASSDLQVAVSYMWLPETKFDDQCSPPSSLPLPLATFDTVWYYSGWGAIPQGNHDPRRLEEELVIESVGGGAEIDYLALLSFLPRGVKQTDPGFPEVVEWLSLIESMLMRKMKVPLDAWLYLSSAADMNSIGCNEDQQYEPRPMVEMNRMIAYLIEWR